MDLPLLKDINKQSFRWKVMARIARVWELKRKDTGTTYEVDFLLLDRQGGTMESLIPEKRMAQFTKHITEGTIYTIEDFNLYDAKSKFRSSDHPLRVCFTFRTKLKKVEPQPVNFPIFAHNVRPFSVLEARADQNFILSDVIGVIVQVTELLPGSSANPDERCQIYITDGNQRAVVTLWGTHATTFNAAGLVESSATQHIVALFVGVTVSHYSGLLAFKSTSVTKLYVNIPIPEMETVRHNVTGIPSQIEWFGNHRARKEPVDARIAEIAELEPNHIMDERYRFSILVTEVILSK
ncbi:hypothetical protein VPH35_049183 [Triticum aestivum]|uniref:uncharacterized protein n=1 Tax=Triticum aestivum TaxID=4565 RepID=UPI000845269E|nr:uncharacterized protein LOC123064515 [Triticum aestivum]